MVQQPQLSAAHFKVKGLSLEAEKTAEEGEGEKSQPATYCPRQKDLQLLWVDLWLKNRTLMSSQVHQ